VNYRLPVLSDSASAFGALDAVRETDLATPEFMPIFEKNLDKKG
jgi:hypothetical protein